LSVIGVVVVADIPLYRQGLAQALNDREGIRVVGTAPSSPEGLESIADLEPDVALVDVATTNGLAAVRSVADVVPSTKIVALALRDSEDEVIAFAEAGACGCVFRSGTLADVESVITSVSRGEALLSPRITASLLSRLSDLASERAVTAAEARLTSREAEIAEMLDEGLSNKEIAQRLSIALSTVKNHVHSILEKLQVTRRGEAVARIHGREPRDRGRRAL
jgi:two-component system, NarL family, nitrate/nitrite response regulator NarL